jgi:NhaP-type Na+/H+ or K+/H+ antiporter
LGALLASTDPAAIIPLLKGLRFKNRSVKDIIISESAVTDVAGTLLTVVFLSLIAKGVEFASVSGWYLSIFTKESALVLGKEILFGALIGVFGYFVLEFLHRHKAKSHKEHEVDSAYFLFVPIFIFSIALAFGGSGYLAAFVAGLMFSVSEHLEETENFFNFLVEGFMKPGIFLMLGALVDISGLLSYAAIGLGAAFVFMFIIRPLAVFITAGPFSFFGRDRLSFKDLLFISFVRETGVIPAVLLTTIISLGIAGIDGLVEVGMWVILATLIIEPIFTVMFAKALKVADPISEDESEDMGNSPIALLASRGSTFAVRLPKVADWVLANGNVRKVILLICLEDKYTKEAEAKAKELALESFQKTNERLIAEGKPELSFTLISRQGFLQDSIDHIAKEHGEKVIIFIGKKMLDYRLKEVKNLGAPLYFME